MPSSDNQYKLNTQQNFWGGGGGGVHMANVRKNTNSLYAFK